MKILVSSCLLGENVRYDSKSSIYSIEDLQLFNKIILENKVFSICPEISGGLLTPREPAEIIKNQELTRYSNFIVLTRVSVLFLCLYCQTQIVFFLFFFL